MKMDKEVSTIPSDTSGLEDKQLKVYRLLAEKSELLAGIYLGMAHASLSKNNPDYLSQAAHSARELIEKAPKELANLAINFKSGDIKEDARKWILPWNELKQKTQWSSSPPWQGEIDANLASILTLIDDFSVTWKVSIAPPKDHYNKMINHLSPHIGALPSVATDKFSQEFSNLKGYFNAVCHHDVATTETMLLQRIGKLEDLLITLLNPEPIPDMDELELLIVEGETA